MRLGHYALNKLGSLHAIMDDRHHSGNITGGASSDFATV